MKRFVDSAGWPAAALLAALLFLSTLGTNAFAQTGTICKVSMAGASGYVTDAPSCSFSVVSVSGAAATNLTFLQVSVVPAGYTAVPYIDLGACDSIGSPPTAGATTLTPCQKNAGGTPSITTTTITSTTTIATTTTTTAAPGSGSICKVSMASAAGYVAYAPSCSFSALGVNSAAASNLTFSLVSVVPSGFTAVLFSNLGACSPLGSPPSPGATTLTPCSQSGTGATLKTLTGISIAGAASVDETRTASYIVTASYSDGSSAAVTATISATGGTATISGNQLTAKSVTADQLVTISATYSEGGISKSASQSVTIRNAFNLLVSLQIAGGSKVDEKATEKYSATAQFDDGSAKSVVPTWGVSIGNIASITADGILTANRVTQDTTVVLNASYTEGPTGYAVAPITRTATQNVVIRKIFIDINLVEKWNLIGNGTDISWDVATLFGDSTRIVTVWKWAADTKKWAFYSPHLSTQDLISYVATKGYDLLSTINSGEGAWCNVTTPFTISVPMRSAVLAKTFQTTLVSQSWNLISIGETKTPSTFNLDIAPPNLDESPPSPGQVASIPISLTTLWAWDAMNWYFYAPTLEQQGGTALKDYTVSKGYFDFTATGKTLAGC